MVDNRAEGDGQEVTLRTIRDEVSHQGREIRATIEHLEGEARKIGAISMGAATGVALFVGGTVMGQKTGLGQVLIVVGFSLLFFCYLLTGKYFPGRKS